MRSLSEDLSRSRFPFDQGKYCDNRGTGKRICRYHLLWNNQGRERGKPLFVVQNGRQPINPHFSWAKRCINDRVRTACRLVSDHMHTQKVASLYRPLTTKIESPFSRDLVIVGYGSSSVQCGSLLRRPGKQNVIILDSPLFSGNLLILGRDVKLCHDSTFYITFRKFKARSQPRSDLARMFLASMHAIVIPGHMDMSLM
jgi:hypothetical protein